MAARTVAAAGGVVWRVRAGIVEVALIHRPRYDDWTLPKGKLEPGEPELSAAVREVREELGARVAVARRIGRVRYVVDSSRKSVAYWAMRYLDGEFVANDEADDVAWLKAGKARKVLSYDVDRSVVADFASVPTTDSVLVLVRHGRAGKRSEWRGEDALRPLDEVGLRQAAALATFLPYFAPTRIYSADRVRCVQTVEPLAAALDMNVRIEPAFNDESFLRSPSTTQTALLALAKPGKVSVVCSQGITIPSMVDRLGPGGGPPDTRKGAVWVLSVVDGDVVAADYYEDCR
ncbi:MAG: NUDIX hydrolase [Jatrophihabitantaceae bacterium]